MITDDDFYRVQYRALYRAHNDTLVAIGRSEFGMTEADAAALAHECLLALLTCLESSHGSAHLAQRRLQVCSTGRKRSTEATGTRQKARGGFERRLGDVRGASRRREGRRSERGQRLSPQRSFAEARPRSSRHFERRSQRRSGDLPRTPLAGRTIRRSLRPW